jgi:enoyl-CoA hydratase/carnithine racemase
MPEDYPRPRPAEDFSFGKILYVKAGGIATVTLNRPEVLNALDFQTLRELSRAFEDTSWDDSIAVLVLTGYTEGAQMAMKIGAKDVLMKPFEKNAFVKKVIRLLEEPAAADSKH